MVNGQTFTSRNAGCRGLTLVLARRIAILLPTTNASPTAKMIAPPMWSMETESQAGVYVSGKNFSRT